MCMLYLPSVLCILVIVFCYSYPMYISVVVDMCLSFVRINPTEKVYCWLLLQSPLWTDAPPQQWGSQIGKNNFTPLQVFLMFCVRDMHRGQEQVHCLHIHTLSRSELFNLPVNIGKTGASAEQYKSATLTILYISAWLLLLLYVVVVVRGCCCTLLLLYVVVVRGCCCCSWFLLYVVVVVRGCCCCARLLTNTQVSRLHSCVRIWPRAPSRNVSLNSLPLLRFWKFALHHKGPQVRYLGKFMCS